MCNKIQILGDSISLGYGLRSEDKSFVDILKDQLGVGIDVYAECGWTLQDLINNVPLLDNKIEKYEISVLFIGTNGIVSVEEYNYLIHLLFKKSNRVIVCTVPISSHNNRIICQCVEKINVEFCDINRNWTNEFFLKDEIHPNSIGHRQIAKFLLEKLNNC